MARTDSTAVQGVLMRDYDSRNSPSLTPFIDSASLLVDDVITCATAKGLTISTAKAEMIERWLAAHMYKQSDKAFQSKTTLGASASYSGQTAMGFDSTLYGQTAMRLDPSNCLRNIDKQQVATLDWLGKAPSAQTPYEDRD